MQCEQPDKVISGSRGGDVLWWDARFPGQAVRNLLAYKLKRDDGMTAMVVHNHHAVLATATPNQFIKVGSRIRSILVRSRPVCPVCLHSLPTKPRFYLQ